MTTSVNNQVINFLINKGEFIVKAAHQRLDEAIEVLTINFGVSKKELKVSKVENNYFIFRNGNICADMMATENNGLFEVKELTMSSTYELERSIIWE